MKSTWRVHGTADFGPRRLVLGLVRPALCVCAMVVGALRALVVVLVTSLVSELPQAQHGTSAGEYNVVIDAKVEGDQWKDILIYLKAIVDARAIGQDSPLSNL